MPLARVYGMIITCTFRLFLVVEVDEDGGVITAKTKTLMVREYRKRMRKRRYIFSKPILRFRRTDHFSIRRSD